MSDAFADLELARAGDGTRLCVHARPNASRTVLQGVHDGSLKVALAAVPEKGKANKALIAFLSRLLGVGKRSIELTAGHTSRTKTLRITGLTPQELRARLTLTG